MSLIRIAARLSAVEALKGRTLVGDNVMDSEIGSIDIDADGTARTGEDRPFITVYTDSSKTGDVGLRSLSVNGPTDFLFETGIASAMTERDPETGKMEIIGVGIPGTDKNFEFVVDLTIGQISAALTDPANAWGKVFLGLATNFVAMERVRTSGDEKGSRIAAQQLLVRANLFAEPVRGATLAATHPLMKFFALAATLNDPVVATQIALMQAQIAGTATDYKIMQQRFGRTGAEAAATGLYPVGGVITTPVLGGVP